MAGSARPRAQGRLSRSGDREYPSAVARIGTGERPVARSKARADVRGSLHRSLAKHVSSRLSGGAAELRTAHNLHAHRAKNAPLRAHPVLQSLLLACMVRLSSGGRSTACRRASLAPPAEMFCTTQLTRNRRPLKPIFASQKAGRRGSFLRSCMLASLSLPHLTWNGLTPQHSAQGIVNEIAGHALDG